MSEFDKIYQEVYKRVCFDNCPNVAKCHEDCVECDVLIDDVIEAVVDKFFVGTSLQKAKILALADGYRTDEFKASLWVCSKATMKEIAEIVDEMHYF